MTNLSGTTMNENNTDFILGQMCRVRQDCINEYIEIIRHNMRNPLFPKNMDFTTPCMVTGVSVTTYTVWTGYVEVVVPKKYLVKANTRDKANHGRKEGYWIGNQIMRYFKQIPDAPFRILWADDDYYVVPVFNSFNCYWDYESWNVIVPIVALKRQPSPEDTFISSLKQIIHGENKELAAEVARLCHRIDDMKKAATERSEKAALHISQKIAAVENEIAANERRMGPFNWHDNNIPRGEDRKYQIR